MMATRKEHTICKSTSFKTPTFSNDSNNQITCLNDISTVENDQYRMIVAENLCVSITLPYTCDSVTANWLN